MPHIRHMCCAVLCRRRLAVEVYDASAFCANMQQPLGDTVSRIHLLGACGWQVRGGWLGGLF
jgi:hypothetical protein